MNYEDAERRYMTDAVFHHFVDSMVRAIDNLEMSPGEMRAAAVFAEIMHRRTRPMLLFGNGLSNGEGS